MLRKPDLDDFMLALIMVLCGLFASAIAIWLVLWFIMAFIEYPVFMLIVFVTLGVVCLAAYLLSFRLDKWT
jgi:hypothetical protein